MEPSTPPPQLPTDATPRHPLTIWHDDLNLQVTSLRQLLHLRTRTGDTSAREDMKPRLREIGETVTQLEEAIAAVRGYLASERDELARLHAYRQRVAHQTQRISLIRAHLPPEVAEQLALAGAGKENDAAAANGEPPHVAPAPAVVAASAAPVAHAKKDTSPRAANAAVGGAGAKPRAKNAMSRAAPAGAPAAKAAAPGAGADEGPTVRSVSEGELSAAPQYVRGRVTVAKVDDVAKRLTAVARNKYALLGRPLKRLNSAERAHVDGFREGECDETEGSVFLTDGEIKGFGNMRLDANVKAVINVLRHVGSLKEIRGKNRSRVFIIN